MRHHRMLGAFTTRLYIDGPVRATALWSWDFGGGSSVNYSLPSAPPSQVNHTLCRGRKLSSPPHRDRGQRLHRHRHQDRDHRLHGDAHSDHPLPLCVGEPGTLSIGHQCDRYTWSFPDVTFQGPVIEHTFTSVPASNTIGDDEDSQVRRPPPPWSRSSERTTPSPPPSMKSCASILKRPPASDAGFDTYQWLDENEVDISEPIGQLPRRCGEYFVTIKYQRLFQNWRPRLRAGAARLSPVSALDRMR